MPILGGNSTVEINIKVNSDTKGVDEAKQKVEGFGGSLQKIGEIAAGIGLARLAEQFLEFGKTVGSFAVNTAADFEQWKVSFDTMIGNSAESSKLLKEISDFAMKTPFDLPQVIEGSKRLLAYNIEAKEIIPTFEMLGNMAAGVGTDKLPQLILAFGQVKAATKLTGAELRQFSEAGVPLLQALVDKANEQGGVLTKVGGLTKQQGKEMGSLTTKIVDQEFRMKLLTDANKNNGVSWEMLKHKYDQNKTALAEFGAVGEATYTRVKATAADMIEQVSDGTVSFEQVQAALKSMTGEGGKFFELMDKQALTFNGTLSNLRDQLVRVAAEVMGVEMTDEGTFGNIKQGSLFDQLRIGAQEFLDWTNAHKEQIVTFFRTLGGATLEVVKATGELVSILGQLFDWLFKVEENSKLVSSTLIALATVITVTLLPAFFASIVTIGAMIIAAWPLIAVVVALGTAIAILRDMWESNFMNIQQITENVINFVIGKINSLIDSLNFLLQKYNDVMGSLGAEGAKVNYIGRISPVDIKTSTVKSSSAMSTPMGNTNGFQSLPTNKSVNIFQTNQIMNPIDMKSVNRDLSWQLNK